MNQVGFRGANLGAHPADEPDVVVAADGNLTHPGRCRGRRGDGPATGANQRVLDTGAGQSVQEIQYLPGATVKMPAGFNMENFHGTR